MRVLIVGEGQRIHLESDASTAETIALLEVAQAMIIRQTVSDVQPGHASGPTSSVNARAPAIGRRVDAP